MGKGLDSVRTRHGVVVIVIVLDVAMDLLQHLDALSDVCGRWRKATSEILVSGVCLESETKENRAGGETEASNVLVSDHGNQDLVPRIEALASHRASTPNKLFLILDLCIAHRLQHRSCKRRSLVKCAKAGLANNACAYAYADADANVLLMLARRVQIQSSPGRRLIDIGALSMLLRNHRDDG